MAHVSRRALCAAMFLALAIVVALAMPVFASAARPPGSTGTISGVAHGDDGAPLANIQVMLWTWDVPTSAWEMVDAAGTTADGSYLFEGLSAGSYRVAFVEVGGVISSLGVVFNRVPQFYNGHNLPSSEFLVDMFSGVLPNNVDNIDVSNLASGPVGIDATLTLEAASISGRVNDSDGQPIKNGWATLYRNVGYSGQGWSELFSVPIAGDGTYAFRGLYGGVYRVGFRADGPWVPQFYPNTTRFSDAQLIECGPILRAGIDATLAPAALSATGTVVEKPGGAPVVGAAVHASYSETGTDFDTSSADATTAPDGSFELRGMQPGLKYDISIEDPAGRHSTLTTGLSFGGGVVGGLNYTMQRVPSIVEIGNGDPSTQVAREVIRSQFPSGYADVTDMVVTADTWVEPAQAVAAPGLCWAYQVTKPGSVNIGRNAPLVEIPASGPTGDVDALVGWIALANGTADHSITLHVVGSRAAVPDSQLTKIKTGVASLGATVTIDRVTTARGAGACDVAIDVAKRIRSRATASATDALAAPHLAFIGSGSSSQSHVAGSFALSSVSAATGSPVFPVWKASESKRVARALKTLHIAGKNTYVFGNAAIVPESVRTQLRVPKANRVVSTLKHPTMGDFYEAFALRAVSKGWLKVAAPAAVGDDPSSALLGGAAVGDAGGGVVLHDDWNAPTNSMHWIERHESAMSSVWLVGEVADNAWAYHEFLGTPYDDSYEESSAGAVSVSGGSAWMRQIARLGRAYSPRH